MNCQINKYDWVLIVWILSTVVWDVLIWWALWQVVFELNRSPWWAILAMDLSSTPTLYKVLRKRYGIPEEG